MNAIVSLPTFASLTHVHRTKPCAEYPGTWNLYFEDSAERYPTFSEAFSKAKAVSAEGCDEVRIYWQCSDNDPRIGQVWFTPFYHVGLFDCFGRYREEC